MACFIRQPGRADNCGVGTRGAFPADRTVYAQLDRMHVNPFGTSDGKSADNYSVGHIEQPGLLLIIDRWSTPTSTQRVARRVRCMILSTCTGRSA